MRDTAANPAGVAIRPRLAVAADDLTGAADTASGFVASGRRAIVTWPGAAADAVQADVIALDMSTRAMGEDDARSATTRVVTWIRERGIETVYKKSDSLLRGHIGAEVAAALAAWHPGSIAIAAFAFPDAGRTTVGGRQRVSGCDGELPIVPLFERAGLAARAVALASVRAGALTRLFERASADRVQVFVCDAEITSDLTRIARAGMDLQKPVLWVGTGGLARALAPIAFARSLPPRRRPDPPLRKGPIMIVCGSASEIARTQVARLVDSGVAPIELPLSVLFARDQDVHRTKVLTQIGAELARGRDVVVSLASFRGSDDRRAAHGLGVLLARFGREVAGVAATGGDTATAVLRAWCVKALDVIAEIEPGMPLSVAEGESPLAVVTKPGAFGSPEALVRARERLHMILTEGVRTA